LLLFAVEAQAAPTIAAELAWQPVPGATGYRVYCAADGNYRAATPRVASTNKMPLVGFPDTTPFRCVVTGFNANAESQFSDPSILMEAKGGIVYALDGPAVPVAAVCTQPSSTVVPNFQRTDGARPMYRLRTLDQPWNEITNPLVSLNKYVAAGTVCEPAPIVRQTSTTLWLYVTNSTGDRGIALCSRQ
jgi:hypothetical protein